MFKKVELWETITQEVRSNLKPPTLHRLGVLVDGLKIHGAAIVTFVPAAMLEKSPESWSTNELFQRLTLVANVSDVVFAPLLSPNVTTPPKSMLPWMGAALSIGAKIASRIENVATAIVFMLPRARSPAKFALCSWADHQSHFANAAT